MVLNFISFDLETSGTQPEYALQPWRVKQKTSDMLFSSGEQKAFITTWAYCRQTGDKLITSAVIGPQIDKVRKLLQRCIDKGYRIGGWNIAFDAAWLIAYGLEEEVFKAKWIDGLRLWRHYFLEPEYGLDRSKKRPYTLEAYGNEFVPELSGWKDDVDYHDPSPEARKKLLKYNENDAIVAWHGINHFWNRLTPKQQRCALIEADSIPLVAKANLEGMIVDLTKAKKLKEQLTTIADDLLKKLAPHGIDATVVRSPTKLSKILYDDWALPVYKENTAAITGKISRSTDKECLHELAFIDPRAKDLKQFREALGNCKKFVEVPIASVAYNGDGRTHPQAYIFSTYTARLTYASNQSWKEPYQTKTGKTRNNNHVRQTGFAVHQMKRDALFRNIIIAPPGYKILEFDASSQEFKWMAIASGDETMLSLCMPGEDAHSYMAAQIRGFNYRKFLADVQAGNKKAKLIRQLGKLANLALQYRTSARTLRSVARQPPYEIPMDLPEAEAIRNTYLRSYVGIPEYWENQIRQTQELGYVETFAGRRIQVEGDWNGEFAWSMCSTAINYRIQGTGAEQKYLALAVLKPYCVVYGIIFFLDYHDGVLFYVPERLAEKAAVEMKAKLDNLPYKNAWDFTPPVPLNWDAKIGSSWGSLVEF